MKNKKITKIVMMVVLLTTVALVAYHFFHTRPMIFSCAGQQKLYLNNGESLDALVKINVQAKNVSINVKGRFHQKDDTTSKIYRQGVYEYRQLTKELYEAKLLKATQVFTDQSPERLNNNLFGIQVGESRHFRVKKTNDGLIMLGSEYVWVYACKADA